MPTPIQIYIKQRMYKNEVVFQYSFHKNPGLFKWMLSLGYFKYEKKHRLLYSEPKNEIPDLLEMMSKGRLVINKYHIQKELIEKAQEVPENALTKFEIPKYSFLSKLIVKVARINHEAFYLLTTDQILYCKEILREAGFISYNAKLSAFVMPMQEKLLLKILEISAGKIFISLHQHVKLKSVYLRSCFWRQCYCTQIFVPVEYIKHLAGSNYSINTIQNYYSSFFIFMYYCFIINNLSSIVIFLLNRLK